MPHTQYTNGSSFKVGLVHIRTKSHKIILKIEEFALEYLIS